MYNLKYLSDNGKMINFSIHTGFVISNTRGLTANVVEISTTQGFTQIGVTAQSEDVQGKPISVEGVLMGKAADKRKQMLDTIVPQVGGTLVFDNRLEIRVIPQITPDIKWDTVNALYQFTVFAAYPYLRAIERITMSIAGMEPRFRFPINYDDTYFDDPLTHMFGERIQTFFKNVVNTGNVAAPFRVLFFAKTALSNPEIMLMNDSLPFLRINKNMTAGERISIDMLDDNITVTSDALGEVTNAFQYFDIDSTPFKLEAGDNLIRYDAASNRDGLDCRITFPPTFSAAYGDDKTCI